MKTITIIIAILVAITTVNAGQVNCDIPPYPTSDQCSEWSNLEEAGGASYTSFIYNVKKDFPVGVYKFKYKDDREFYFQYDTRIKSYSLSEFDVGEDTVKLSDVFDQGNYYKNSRVLFLRQNGEKQIYGSEQPIKFFLKGAVSSSIESGYQVDLVNFNDFEKEDCDNTLAQFAVDSELKGNTQIQCKTNKINLFSNNLDSQNAPYRGFNIFKNIITSLI